MPRRTDIDSVLIIGAGPIVIGQACEFDYSGVQACKALREEGYRTVLVNSNPATIMTDPETADATYVEPLTAAVVTAVIERERETHPGERMALLPTMGGQTALNIALALERDGTLARLGVEMIGARADAIDKAEDRLRFREAMRAIGLECPRSRLVADLTEAEEALQEVGLPAVIRPSFTLGGAGGGVARDSEEFKRIVAGGLKESPVGTVLVEESVLGWKEFEMEVVRDHADNCIIVCSIENIDPMGIHTGDSVTVAPALTLTDKEYQVMRNAAIAVLREIGVETGGSNVQFAVDPQSGRQLVIEMNPRVSRSSALASKATGFPIARIATKLAVGYSLDELRNDITGDIPAGFEPTIDYIVVKAPRFAFEKFPAAEPVLTTFMKSVGEAMAIGRNFYEALQKALRSLETGLTGFDEIDIAGARNVDGSVNRAAVLAALRRYDPNRLLLIAQAFRFGLETAEIAAATRIDRWFLERIEELVRMEQQIRADGLPQDAAALLRLKKAGFSDARLATLAGTTPKDVAARRDRLGVRPVFKRIDSCAAEFPAQTFYMYSCFEGDGGAPPECEAAPSDRDKAIILGGGPNRIGQGIEFDYCCVHAARALTEAGVESVMINCNPETVSTDYDSSDRLYFEPLTEENVIAICRKEQENGRLLGVVVQFGGQTPLKLCRALEREGIPVLGTSPDAIDLAEDRDRFQKLLRKLQLRQPPNGIARTPGEALRIADQVGYPVVARPSYVLGGRAMEILREAAGLQHYLAGAATAFGDGPILIDGYLKDAIEVDVDALCDGATAHVVGVMEHVEEAGIHSGDSACSLPPHSLPPEITAELERQTRALALGLGVVGLINVQFAVCGEDIFVLEANPRASRTVPFVAKAVGVAVAAIATRLLIGEKLSSFKLPTTSPQRFAVKEAALPFKRFPGADMLLGPEMRSTGESMGLDLRFEAAFARAEMGVGVTIPDGGVAFIAVRPEDLDRIAPSAKLLAAQGFALQAPDDVATGLRQRGCAVQAVGTLPAAAAAVAADIRAGQVHLLVNSVADEHDAARSREIRSAALERGIPYFTTMRAAKAAAEGFRELRAAGKLSVTPLQQTAKLS